MLIDVVYDKGRINQPVLRFKRIIDRAPALLNRFVRSKANELSKALAEAISSQKYVTEWSRWQTGGSSRNPASLTPEYKKKKQKAGMDKGFWQLTGSVLQALQAKQIKISQSRGLDFTYTVGSIVSGRNPGNVIGKWPKPTQIENYLYAMEYGNPATNQPARPIFRPTMRDFIPKWEDDANILFDKIINEVNF